MATDASTTASPAPGGSAPSMEEGSGRERHTTHSAPPAADAARPARCGGVRV
eukprot:gene47347-1523_t